MFYLLAREVKMLRNDIPRSEDWEVMVDLFMHRTITEVKKTADEEEGENEAEEEVHDDVLNKNTAGGEAGEGDEEEEEEEAEAKDDDN